ncbi:MAG: hypothetical protein GY928_01965 [Colwellia sp.]|nr:hypothetical protein [Colwellia sp.]
MGSKIIAGVGVNLDNRDNITYEQLMKSALTTKKYYKNKNAEKLIDKELRANGFKPSKPKGKKNKRDSNIEPIQEGDSKE